MMTKSLSRLGAKCAALVLLTTGAVSCGLENQSAPALTGPSEFGLSLTLRATPDGRRTAVVVGVFDTAHVPVRGRGHVYTADGARWRTDSYLVRTQGPGPT